MYKTLLLSFLLAFSLMQAQTFTGQIFMRENSAIYLNQVYVTNINDQHTVLSNYNGEFEIKAKVGDVIRFTSILSERKDITMDSRTLNIGLNIIELSPMYHTIKEVVIGWKPTGNLRRDVLSLKENEKKIEIQNMLGLPTPKLQKGPVLDPIAGFSGGGLSLNLGSVYELFSGDRKKKQRLYDYERMMSGIKEIKNYLGQDYFTRMKIPANMIDNFLQFVYSSDNLIPFIETGNLESTKVYIEKYLPIYQKRLRDSNLSKLSDENSFQSS